MISSKKYKRVVSYILIALMLFPLIIAVTSTFYSGQFNFSDIITETNQYCISTHMRDNIILHIGESLQFTGDYWTFAATIITNAVCVLLCYTVFKVFAFIPEMCIKFLQMGVGKKDD